jgi:hypothetical protein
MHVWGTGQTERARRGGRRKGSGRERRLCPNDKLRGIYILFFFSWNLSIKAWTTSCYYNFNQMPITFIYNLILNYLIENFIHFEEKIINE